MSYIDSSQPSQSSGFRRRSRIRNASDVLSPRGKADVILILSPSKDSLPFTELIKPKTAENFIVRFVVCLVFMNMFVGMLQYSIKTYATTIERRYGLSGSTIGLFVAGCDFGHLLSLIPATLAASRFSRPWIMAIAGIAMVIGGILCCLPHFLCGIYVPVLHVASNISQEQPISPYIPQLCEPGKAHVIEDMENVTHSSEVAGVKNYQAILDEPQNPICTKTWIKAVFFCSTFLIGFGAGPVTTLYFSYIDDFSPRQKSPLYIALVQMFSIVGVVASYGVAGIISKLYVDIGRVSPHSKLLQPGDFQWVGAWWLGFIISSIGVLFTSLPLMFFHDKVNQKSGVAQLVCEEGSEQQNEQNNLRHKNEQCHQMKNPLRTPKYKVYPANKDVVHPFIRVLKSPVVMITLLSTIGWHIQPLSSGTFVLKYLQQDFGLSISASSIIVGTMIWVPACIAIPLGGYINSQHLNNMKRISIFITVCMLIGSIYYPAGCPAHSIVGLTKNPSDFQNCSASCNCDVNVEDFDPVCGSDGLTYFSPCRAGCKSLDSRDQPLFDNCSCVGIFKFDSPNTTDFYAVNGFCSHSCSRGELLGFIGNFLIRVFVISLTFVPFSIFVMRSVRQNDKAVAIALKDIVAKLLGEIPGSLLAGKLFDSCCLFWSNEQACQLYDLDRLRVRYFMLNVIPSVVAVIAFWTSLLVLKRDSKQQIQIPELIVNDVSDLRRED
ncbi:unnamed protein product [Clavelina lepadiformis]|uniref:Solute carrier organic anion transporter family member n=1 Tax=Clavelina lepadiformis TaxID=159417 RepID=A0ABP0H4W1_CLALP